MVAFLAVSLYVGWLLNRFIQSSSKRSMRYSSWQLKTQNRFFSLSLSFSIFFFFHWDFLLPKTKMSMCFIITVGFSFSLSLLSSISPRVTTKSYWPVICTIFYYIYTIFPCISVTNGNFSFGRSGVCISPSENLHRKYYFVNWNRDCVHGCCASVGRNECAGDDDDDKNVGKRFFAIELTCVIRQK